MPSSPTQTTPDELPLTLAGPPWRWIGAAIAVVCGLQYATLWRYGYHRDELYFLMLRPAWGYVDQPPLTPLLAGRRRRLRRHPDRAAGAGAVLRRPAAIVLVALTTRELGGGRRPRRWPRGATRFAALPLLSGHLLVTATVDLALWTAVLLFVTRALLRDEPRWWLAAGAVVGLALYNKLLIVMLLIALAIGLLARRAARRRCRSRLAVGRRSGSAVALGSPNLIYQVTHHFPQVTMAGALPSTAPTQVREQVVPFQVLLIGPPLSWSGVLGFVATPAPASVAAGPRPSPSAYLVALLVNLWAAARSTTRSGCWPSWSRPDGRPARGPRWLLVAAVAVNAVFGAILALPLLPVTEVGFQAGLNSTIGDQVGWPTYVGTLRPCTKPCLPTTEHAPSSSPATTARPGLSTATGQGLPAVYSGQNELYFHGPPPATADVVSLWTEDYPAARTLFDRLPSAAAMDNGVGVDNEEQGSVVAVCRVPPPGWAALWPRLQHFD